MTRSSTVLSCGDVAPVVLVGLERHLLALVPRAPLERAGAVDLPTHACRSRCRPGRGWPWPSVDRTSSSAASGCLSSITSVVSSVSAYVGDVDEVRRGDGPDLWVEHPVEGRLCVVGGEGGAVVELHAFAQREGDRLAVLADLPLGRQARLEVALVGRVDQGVVDQVEGLRRLERGRSRRVATVDVAGAGDDERLLARRCRPPCRMRGCTPVSANATPAVSATSARRCRFPAMASPFASGPLRWDVIFLPTHL